MAAGGADRIGVLRAAPRTRPSWKRLSTPTRSIRLRMILVISRVLTRISAAALTSVWPRDSRVISSRSRSDRTISGMLHSRGSMAVAQCCSNSITRARTTPGWLISR